MLFCFVLLIFIQSFSSSSLEEMASYSSSSALETPKKSNAVKVETLTIHQPEVGSPEGAGTRFSLALEGQAAAQPQTVPEEIARPLSAQAQVLEPQASLTTQALNSGADCKSKPQLWLDLSLEDQSILKIFFKNETSLHDGKYDVAFKRAASLFEIALIAPGDEPKTIDVVDLYGKCAPHVFRIVNDGKFSKDERFILSFSHHNVFPPPKQFTFFKSSPTTR